MISIVIVHWNTPSLLRKSLNLLTKDPDLQIIVIDNNSMDQITWVERQYPSVKLIQNKINRGFSYACNQGVIASIGDWIIFLNPDVIITGEEIRSMLQHAASDNLDAFSPNQESENYKLPLPTPFSLLAQYTALARIIPKSVTRKLTGGTSLFGGCLGIKRKVLMDIGGWDERYFVWFEDADLTKQLLDSKYKIGWVPIKISHVGGTSFNKMSQQTKIDLFFNAMTIYGKRHFEIFGKIAVYIIRKRHKVSNLLPEMMPGVSITVPNMKVDLLDRFLNNNRDYLKEIDQVNIVTSAIKKESVWQYRKLYPEIRFIVIDQNDGFAPTVNIGFLASPTKWIGTINDDVELNDSWLTKLLTNPPVDAGSLNPVIHTKEGTIESAGIEVLPKGKAKPINILPEGKFSKTDATNGAAVIYKNSALQHTGIFDERFGSYLEDIDLSLRLKRNGFNNYVCNVSNITHIGQSTSHILRRKKNWLDFKNWILLISKNWTTNTLIYNFPRIFVERLRNISGIIKA